MAEVKVAYHAPDECGECPRWNERDQRLYWTDIYRPAINRLDPVSGAFETFAMPEAVASFSFREAGGLVAGTRTGFAFIDLEAGTFERLVNPLPDSAEFRMNDGCCDPAGRFWCGSMTEGLSEPLGKLYRLDPDLSVTEMADGLICPNGTAFSPDGRLMYRSDSRLDKVWVSDYDLASGTFSNERVFVDNDLTEGRPDGAALDSEGCYWSTQIQGWRVMRYTPDGKVDRVIGLPAQRVTMCGFGGPDLTTLFVASAVNRIPEGRRAKQPLAGALFSIDVGVRGLVEPRFKG